jgi:tetratricopeptide (TPR) repeat protein
MADERTQMALELFQRAYQLQMQGEWDLAVDLYRQSIALQPTAEAYTFLGWTYRFQGRLEDAIAECRKAIELDPSFGNPYNDIGAYLIELDRAPEAIPWLEQATTSRRYDSFHYPWYNLGRAYAAMECYRKAQECFAHSLDIEPRYKLAEEAIARLKRMIQ